MGAIASPRPTPSAYGLLRLYSYVTILITLSTQPRSLAAFILCTEKKIRCDLPICSYSFLFCFSYVYIPVLPSSLLEVLNTPTPFIAGVHSMHREEIKDLVSAFVFKFADVKRYIGLLLFKI